MNYHRTTPRQLLLSIGFLQLIFSLLSWHIPPVKWIAFFVFAFCICNAFITYEVEIHQTVIRYKIRLFRWTIYNKEYLHTDVFSITFKRAGWNAKVAVIKARNSLPVRVGYFKTNVVYRALLTFCEEHEISCKKTKDFNRMEKLTLGK
jgi:hypothetical protein